MSAEDILLFLKEHKAELKEKFGVLKIGLFGSYARHEETDVSDIDIVIESETKDFFIRDDLREYLEASFHKSVDVGYLDSIRPFYRQKIEPEIIYA